MVFLQQDLIIKLVLKIITENLFGDANMIDSTCWRQFFVLFSAIDHNGKNWIMERKRN